MGGEQMGTLGKNGAWGDAACTCPRTCVPRPCSSLCMYKARHAHKRLYTVLPKYSKIQVLPDITSCRLVKDNKQAIELNSLLLNNLPKDGYG